MSRACAAHAWVTLGRAGNMSRTYILPSLRCSCPLKDFFVFANLTKQLTRAGVMKTMLRIGRIYGRKHDYQLSCVLNVTFSDFVTIDKEIFCQRHLLSKLITTTKSLVKEIRKNCPPKCPNLLFSESQGFQSIEFQEAPWGRVKYLFSTF